MNPSRVAACPVYCRGNNEKYTCTYNWLANHWQMVSRAGTTIISDLLQKEEISTCIYIEIIVNMVLGREGGSNFSLLVVRGTWWRTAVHALLQLVRLLYAY